MTTTHDYEPDSKDPEFLAIKNAFTEMAIGLIDEVKTHGRKELLGIIGTTFMMPQTQIIDICSGHSVPPDNTLKRQILVTNISIGAVFVALLIELCADPNTQWDSPTLLYYQTKDRLEKLVAYHTFGRAIKKAGKKR